jgi:SAM-dependent methyltransferase
MTFPSLPGLLALLPVALLIGCTSAGSGDEVYRPMLGQTGKDVMWVPTLDTQVMPMLEAAAVTAEDIVYDLGSGDGKIPIWAARRFGARAVGIEYDPKLSALAQRNAERAGVTDRVRMIQGDIFRIDFSEATVVTLYLGRDLNLKLRPTLLAMRPGTRVVSNAFDMDTWQPDRTIRVGDQNPVYLWVVPARVEGDWALEGLSGEPQARLRLTQQFQTVRGTLELPGRPGQPVEGRLSGRRLELAIPTAGGRATLQADIDADSLSGVPGGPAGQPLRGRRVR